MEYHLIHALVLTPFESSLVPLEWEAVAATDFAVHALFCKESARLLFHSDGTKNDCAEEISKVISTIQNLGNCAEIERTIIILEKDENEYNAQDVIKHFQ